MASRQQALAQIQTYIEHHQGAPDANTPIEDENATTPPLAPHFTDDIPTRLGPEAEQAEKQRLSEVEKAQQEDIRLGERADKSKYAMALRAEKERLAEEKRERALAEQKKDDAQKLVGNLARLGTSLGGILRVQGGRAKSRLERLPMPGGIWVPLMIVLVVFLVLFPVNGHPRIVWLWLTIIGDATIGTPPPPTVLPPAGGQIGNTATVAVGGGPPVAANGHSVTGNYGALLQSME